MSILSRLFRQNKSLQSGQSSQGKPKGKNKMTKFDFYIYLIGSVLSGIILGFPLGIQFANTTWKKRMVK